MDKPQVSVIYDDGDITMDINTDDYILDFKFVLSLGHSYNSHINDKEKIYNFLSGTYQFTSFGYDNTHERIRLTDSHLLYKSTSPFNGIINRLIRIKRSDFIVQEIIRQLEHILAELDPDFTFIKGTQES